MLGVSASFEEGSVEREQRKEVRKYSKCTLGPLLMLFFETLENSKKDLCRENKGRKLENIHIVHRVPCLRCFLRLWKNNHVSRKHCKQISD